MVVIFTADSVGEFIAVKIFEIILGIIYAGIIIAFAFKIWSTFK
jgi:hypothetical protein